MRAYEEVRAAYMRVFDFDGTIYDGESLFDLDEPHSTKWNTVWANYATDI